MDMTNVLSFGVSITGIIITFIVLVLRIMKPDLVENKSDKKHFMETLKKGLISKQITYSDLQHIAECWNQNRTAILLGLRGMLSEAINGEKDLIKSIDIIRDLLETHQKSEPFAELPENISLQLADMRNNPEESKIEQLASSLSTLYKSHKRSLSKEKNMTNIGFFIGLLALVWSFVSHFLK